LHTLTIPKKQTLLLRISSQPTLPTRARGELADSASDPELSWPRRRSQKSFYLPRRCYIPPDSFSYNYIIRLEGQILALVSILRFHLRYASYSLDDLSLDALRLCTLNTYFNVIEELVGHIDHGCDLTYQRGAGDLVYIAQKRYFPRVRRQCGDEEVEKEGHWPRIL
jgi:hypothetical protein